ncbi:unnamed protein product [Parascedosporium putredinis]|uniref:Uncharacterized protein n=1 Tax=Parascedosporium putredinis TaxID=1442378 RepID=A0A9P1GWI8_9PEZI|nr:unnamed protein product [Parascedosporium putredinis]CAI7988295.1 unnamed protein product [Parascedosporium putredinis]
MAPAPSTKLAPIPKGRKIQKRPLPASNNPLPPTPASSTCPLPPPHGHRQARPQAPRQVRHRRLGSPLAKKMGLSARIEALQKASGKSTGAGAGAEVTVLGTGKAVEKTLRVASWFSQEPDCLVSIKTKTVGAVDDIVAVAADNDDDDAQAEDESRVRKLSCLEVTISLR